MARQDRSGQRVKITAGMTKFVGQTGRILYKEYGGMYRVQLDTPVNIPGIGLVRDDIWESQYLKRIK